MTENIENLKGWLDDIADLIAQNENLAPEHYTHFLQEPGLALQITDVIIALKETDMEEKKSFYSASVFALEICVAQLQAAMDAGNKPAAKTLKQLMANMAQCIRESGHSINFWLPILNAFYEVHADLTNELKDAYFDLASQEELPLEDEETHINSIRDLLEELSDLSIFDVAENLFAQSYAMPPDFFSDLIIDLYSIEEGQDLPILMLLHSNAEVREVVIATLDAVINQIIMTPDSLSRLKTIASWYPADYKPRFDQWIKLQRKKGVVFKKANKAATMRIKASEVDGSGAQGIFIHCKKRRIHRLCGLLFKYELGIKDAWFTPALSNEDVEQYYNETFEETVMLRTVDTAYLMLMTNHFLALNLENGLVPNLHLLEMQEELGLPFQPNQLDVDDLLETLIVQVTPFTPERVQDALKRTKIWSKNKRFTESWYVENAEVDKRVNQFCSFIEGIKVCDFDKAQDAILIEEMEPQRNRWQFHFLWVALWLKTKARKNEKAWEDALLIAHAIHTGMPLSEIPIMQEISRQTVINSIETMQERRTHLT